MPAPLEPGLPEPAGDPAREQHRRIVFTKARLDALRFDAADGGKRGRTIVWDAEVRGLACQVSAGSKSLWLIRWACGRARFMRLGDHPSLSVDDARRLAQGLLGAIANGERPWEDRTQARAADKVAMGDLWESYLAKHALPNKRPSSVKMDCWLWARVLAPAFKVRLMTCCPDGHVGAEVVWTASRESYEPRRAKQTKTTAGKAKSNIVTGATHTRERHPCPTCGTKVEARWTGGRLAADLMAEDVRRLHETITQERGATLANRAAVLVGTIFAKAAPDLTNPAARSAEYRHRETSRDRHMAGPELSWFWEGVAEEAAPWPLFFLLAATTGARLANLLSMPWPGEGAELDLARGTWRIPGHKSKGGTEMKLSLPPVVCDRLRAWRAECPSKAWVFPQATDPKRHTIDPGRAWDRIRWRMEARRLLQVLAGIESWPPERLDVETAGLADLADAFWRAALGRRESGMRHPLARVVDALRDRVAAAGGDPSEGTVMDLRFHDIRRSVGAHMAMAGFSEAEIGRQLGHAPGSKSTRIYGRIGQDHAAHMAAIVAGKMLGHSPGAAAAILGARPTPAADVGRNQPDRINAGTDTREGPP
ncbi:hypothetical protein LBMAG53_22770 [Planctomycetota bacterium]|nr:hypothetical protein LBMAG53_22770 [Planctomycetota bacterium]